MIPLRYSRSLISKRPYIRHFYASPIRNHAISSTIIDGQTKTIAPSSDLNSVSPPAKKKSASKSKKTNTDDTKNEKSTKEAEKTTEKPPESKEIELAAKDDEVPERFYFDTQKMYTNLKYAGFTDGQADATMHTISELVLKAWIETKDRSIPQWAAENEAYLFEAACSEIRNDIQTSRQAQAENYKADLSRLQRDMESLQHESNEMIQSLKTDLEMDINERKDMSRAENNATQLQIQELNNKITIDINSDAKSDIEALRWQTTRRGLTGIVIVAGCILLATMSKTEAKKPSVPPPPVKGEEYRVPMLMGSEIDEPEETKKIESLV